MSRKLSPDDLVGAHEIAQRLGLAFPNIVHAWRIRYKTFPEPIAVLRAGMIWDWKKVEAWAKMTNRRPQDIEEQENYLELVDYRANAKSSATPRDLTLGKSPPSKKNAPQANTAGGGETKRTRHSPQQIVFKMREADRLVAKGMPLYEVARHLGISTESYRRWRTQNRTATPNDMTRMKTIERENARLKKLLAEKELDNDILREAIKEK
jgi:transposase-like protein